MNRTILLVDDEENILHALTRVLRKTGYRVLTATSGQAGLALLATEEVQVVLSDQKMPNMTGSEFLAKVDADYPQTVRMVLTGYAELSSVADAINRGHIFKFLLKPWDETLLLSNIREAFERHDLGIRGALFSKIFEITSEGILITDQHGVIQAVNPAFTQITEFTEAEAIGQTPALLRSGRHQPEFYQEMWTKLSSTGNWAGEIWNKRKNGEMFPQWLNISAIRNHQGDVQQYVGLFTDITLHKLAEDALRHRAYHDHLTDLPNRAMYTELLDKALSQARRHDQHCAVMMMDLDHFKDINDTYGHDVGDKLLITVAQRLRECLRKEDTLARMGGDEFTLLLPQAENLEDIAKVAEKILAALAVPICIDQKQLSTTPSIGIAVYPNDGGSPETLLKHADEAMYRVKTGGRNAYRFYA